MSAARLIKYLQFAYFSKASIEKTIFRTIRTSRAGHLVELGVGPGQLAKRMIALAAGYTSRPTVRYTGIDLFELRGDDGAHLSLRQTHQLLCRTDARVRLIPGDPYAALAKHANMLLDTDLVVIHADQDPELIQHAWFYVPRMLHAGSRVIIESPCLDEPAQVLDLAAVQELAVAHMPRRRAA